MVITDPGVLDLAAQEVTVRASAGEGDRVVIALGRFTDVEAWVGQDAHTRVTGLVDLDTLSSEAVAAEEDPAEEDPAEGTEGEPTEGDATEGDTAEEGEDTAVASAPDPEGSDLWLAEASGQDEAELRWQAEPGRWSVLVATTGESAGPPSVTLTWPQEVRTPWLVPGLAVGGVLLVAGLAWWSVLIVRGRAVSRTAGVGAAPLPVREPGRQQSGRPAAVTGSHVATVTAGHLAGRATTAAPSSGSTSDGAAEASSELSAPAAPLTRRQIRELEQQRALEARREPRRGRARAARPEQPEAQASARPAQAQQPPASATAAKEPAAAETSAASKDRATPIEDSGSSVPPVVETPRSETTDEDSAGRGRGRLGRLGLRGLGRRAPEPSEPEAHPVPTEVTEQDPPQAPTLTWSSRPGAGQAASGDAWRRAWGFASPDADGTAETPHGTGTDGERDDHGADAEGGQR